MLMYHFENMPDGAEVQYSALLYNEDFEPDSFTVRFCRNGQVAECVLPAFDWTRMDDEFEDMELGLYGQYLTGKGTDLLRAAKAAAKEERAAKRAQNA